MTVLEIAVILTVIQVSETPVKKMMPARGVLAPDLIACMYMRLTSVFSRKMLQVCQLHCSLVIQRKSRT